MIWKRKERDEEAAVQAIRSRFATVLGLDREENGSSFRTGMPNSPDSESLEKGHVEAPSPATTSENPGVAEEIKEKRIRLEEHLTYAESLASAANRTPPFMQGFYQPTPLASEALIRVVDDEAKQLVQKTKALIEMQTKLFEHTFARILNHAFSQAETSLHNAACRLEAFYAQVAEAEDSQNRWAADYSQVAFEARPDQFHGFESDVANIAKRFESGTSAEHPKLALGHGEQE
jgi:hypothetical protein